jgi:hypothetical protein
MRLSDAVAELEGIEGAQTHRSWWVAKMAVEGAQRGDGRATLPCAAGRGAGQPRLCQGVARGGVVLRPEM